MPDPTASMGYPGVAGLPMPYGHPPMYLTPAALRHLQNHSPPVESEEKRAKRLERNRESARKSRLRKKERLSKLEEQVAGLHDKIEAARTIQIQDMNPRLHNYFLQRVLQLDEGSESGVVIESDSLAVIFRGTGLNCEVQRASMDFQYSKLKRNLLPRYQKFLLWLTLHEESWFTTGKEQYAQREACLQSIRVSSGKISSKQVGDEITNGPKISGDDTPASRKKAAKARLEREAQTAGAFDPLRMWPLLCFELSISVDQEERLLHAIKTAKQRPDIQDSRSQIEAATRMASRLKEAVLLQSHNVSVRSGRAYLDILNPKQSIRFHKWLANNRERCHDSLKGKSFTQQTPATILMDDSSMAENKTLIDVCRRLEAVLKISKGEN
jgi:bZIP transcription factor